MHETSICTIAIHNETTFLIFGNKVNARQKERIEARERGLCVRKTQNTSYFHPNSFLSSAVNDDLNCYAIHMQGRPSREKVGLRSWSSSFSCSQTSSETVCETSVNGGEMSHSSGTGGLSSLSLF